LTSRIKKRLIELSISLDAISAQSARENSIHHGHISTLHIWWARRAVRVRRLLRNPERRIPVELLVVTPQELKQRLEIGDQFMQEILSKGEMLYAR